MMLKSSCSVRNCTENVRKRTINRIKLKYTLKLRIIRLSLSKTESCNEGQNSFRSSPRYPSSSGRLFSFEAATASLSHISLSGFFECPFIQINSALCFLYILRNLFQRSGFFVLRNPLFSQTLIHPLLTALHT